MSDLFRDIVRELNGTESARHLTVQIKHTGFDLPACNNLTVLLDGRIKCEKERAAIGLYPLLKQ